MPTLRKMIVDFNENRYGEQREQALLVGEEEYSLIQQSEIIGVLDKNIIKTTKKESLNQQIAEAIEESFRNIKKVDYKVIAKDLTKSQVHISV